MTLVDFAVFALCISLLALSAGAWWGYEAGYKNAFGLAGRRGQENDRLRARVKELEDGLKAQREDAFRLLYPDEEVSTKE